MANGWFSQFPERSQAAQIADAAVAKARDKQGGPGQASAGETVKMASLLSSYLDAYGGAEAGAALFV